VNLQSFSVEFFPPKDNEGEERLWNCAEQLKSYRPDFAAVTYGAGGSTRDRTIKIAQKLSSKIGSETVAHLTCVGSTKAQLIEILDSYQAAGIKKILALRGDPVGGPQSPWITTPGGFDHALQLVELAAEKGFEVSVAAFPDIHPASDGNFQQDIEVLLAKEKAGASFAYTQFFFEIDNYLRLSEALKKANSNLPILAGILPITNLKQLDRMATLSGANIPNWLRAKFQGYENDPTAIKKIGIEIATELSEKLMANGVPGLHFYTMNMAGPTKAVIENLGWKQS
jgi:methylenetetrahydrofolate reductase (NADPH)